MTDDNELNYTIAAEAVANGTIAEGRDTLDAMDAHQQELRTIRRDLLYDADAAVDAARFQICKLWRAGIVPSEFAGNATRALDRVAGIIEKAKHEL